MAIKIAFIVLAVSLGCANAGLGGLHKRDIIKRSNEMDTNTDESTIIERDVQYQRREEVEGTYDATKVDDQTILKSADVLLDIHNNDTEESSDAGKVIARDADLALLQHRGIDVGTELIRLFADYRKLKYLIENQADAILAVATTTQATSADDGLQDNAEVRAKVDDETILINIDAFEEAVDKTEAGEILARDIVLAVFQHRGDTVGYRVIRAMAHNQIVKQNMKEQLNEILGVTTSTVLG